MIVSLKYMYVHV